MHEPTPRPAELTATLTPSAPCLCLKVRGELDLFSAKELPLDDYPGRPDLTMVLVDLGELTFCDSAGLRALLTFSRMQQAQGRSVAVVRATPFIWRLMRLCGITDRLTSVRPAQVLAPV